MNTILIFVIGTAGGVGLLAGLIWAMARSVRREEEERQRALKAEADAALQEEYARIATRGRSVDDTGRVLDDGKF